MKDSIKRVHERGSINVKEYGLFMKVHVVVLGILCMLFCAAIPVCAQEQYLLLNVLELTHEQNRTMMRADIAVSDVDALRKLLRDGARIALNCSARVEVPRSMLPNTTVAQGILQSHVRYDALTREFFIFHGSERPRRDKDLAALLRENWGNLLIPLEVTEEIPEGLFLQARLSVQLQHTEVPPWLERALFFWSWDVAPPVTFSRDVRL